MAEENEINFESFNDEQKSFINGLVEEKTKGLSRPDIDFTQASEFIRNTGGLIFPNEEDYKTKKLDAARSIAANWETDARKSIKEQTNVEWKDGEKVSEYAIRAIQDFEKKAQSKKLDDSFNAELETTKSRLQEKESDIQKLQEQINLFNQEKETNWWKGQVNSVISDKDFAIPNGTPDEQKKDFIDFYKNKYYNWVENNFERGKDEQGNAFLRHKAKGSVSTDISKFISEHLSESGIAFGSSKNGYSAPNASNGLTEEARKKAIETLENEMFSKGVSANDAQFIAEEIRRGLKTFDDVSKTKPKLRAKVQRLLQL